MRNIWLRRVLIRTAIWRLIPIAGFLLLATISTIAQGTPSYTLPNADGSWQAPGENVARAPTGPIRISIQGVGRFEADPQDVEQNRPDIFKSGHISVFDLLVDLDKLGAIDLAYHYDEGMATHVIDSINGESNWWYMAHYDGGWYERNVTRMDLYPVKDGTLVRIERESASRLDAIYESFRAEVERLASNSGAVIIPSVSIRGPRRGTFLEFDDVEVTAHGVRKDLFQPGVITALDIILSLGEQGKLSEVGLTWYDHIFGADPVDSYYIEKVEAEGFSAQASGGCGFVYEVGPRRFAGFNGSHIHIATDARVLLSPEYALWFWLCL